MRSFTKTYSCPCAAGSHAVDLVVPEWRYMAQMIEKLGENIHIQIMDNQNKRFRTWDVPRIYIAKHGIKANLLPKMGFEEIVPIQAGVN